MNRSRVPFLALSVAFAATLLACGGVHSPTSNTSGPPASIPTGGTPATSGGNVGTPITVQVAAGQTAAGVDIAVTGPASSPAPNAQVLGVAPVGPGGTAYNTGSIIHRGANEKVLLFGPGLNGSMQVQIGGPNDIAVSNVVGISSTQGTSGVAFNVAVSGNAALGARTVFLRNQQNDISAFTGGLEVVP